MGGQVGWWRGVGGVKGGRVNDMTGQVVVQLRGVL